jgi:glyoxylate/hydroxypyruvate reductase
LHDSDEPLSATELATFVQGASSLVCLLSDRINAAVMDAAGPTLRSIATMSVGYSNIDVPAALARGVRIGNTPGVLTDATADLVLALTLATCRLLPQAALAVRSGEWSSWKPFWSACPLCARATLLPAASHSLSLAPPLPVCGTDVHHKHVGIIGLGRIGEAIARRFRGFDCSISYTGRSGPKPEVAASLGGATYLPLPQLLSTCDIVVVICPLTAETRGFLGAPQLALLKDSAVLINAARGEVLVQEALVQALTARPTLRAGLDVTDPEPLPTDHPLLALPNCLVLPHIGSASMSCRLAMAELTVGNALAGMEGEAMPAEVPETLAAARQAGQ